MRNASRDLSNAVRQALVVLPLGLILAGCAGNHGSVSSAGRPDRHSARTAGTARAADRSGSRSNALLASDGDESFATDPQHNITLDEIREHVRNGTAVLIDARSPEAYARGHARGALNLPAGPDMDAYLAKIRQDLALDQLLIIYCTSSTCGSSDMVYEFLESKGFTNMRVYTPGWRVLASAQL